MFEALCRLGKRGFGVKVCDRKIVESLISLRVESDGSVKNLFSLVKRILLHVDCG